MSTRPPPGGTAVRPAWSALPEPVRRRVAERLGAAVVSVADQSGGFTPGVAARLQPEAGPGVFLKAVPAGHPLADAYRWEGRVAERLPDTAPAPRLRWREEIEGWTVLTFDDVDGRHPDFSPGSADIPTMVETVAAMSRTLTPCPVPHAEPSARARGGWLHGWQALDRSGCSVELVVGDGAVGWAAGAPYDRIIVTAGAWDVCTSWREQLADGGLLLVPLRMTGLTRAVALRRDDEVLRSESLTPCGFIPLRGEDAMSEQNVWVGGKDGDLLLRIDDGTPVDAEAAGSALEHPGVVVWTGSGFVMPVILDFWLARSPGFCRVLASRDAVSAGRIASPLFPWGSMGVLSGGTVAYLTAAPDFSEIGVAAYGPDGQALAVQVAARIREWNTGGGPRMTVSVEVHPSGTQPMPGAWLVLEKKDSTVMITMRGGNLLQ